MSTLDEFLEDVEYPVRAPVDDPMWIPDRIDRATMAGAFDDEAGSIFGRIAHAVTQPARSVVNIATRAIETPFQVAERVATLPFALAARAANALPTMPGGGGGGGAAAAPGPSMPDDQPPADPGDGGGDDPMAGTWMHPSSQRFRGHPHHRHAAAMGFGLPDWHPLAALERLNQRINPFASPAGELLVSAVPGGVAAKDAHAIASKALKDGTLNPAHLKQAGSLARAARSGHTGSLKKIAQIKGKAGRGDPHAEVALDRLRLADSIQRGGTVDQSTTSLRHLRNIGLATLKA